jgi:hypothetical protein
VIANLQAKLFQARKNRICHLVRTSQDDDLLDHHRNLVPFIASAILTLCQQAKYQFWFVIEESS